MPLRGLLMRRRMVKRARPSSWPDLRLLLTGDFIDAQTALQQGLEINAGHDLNRDNLADFLRAVPGVLEVSIGHALVADALELGLPETVRAYQRCIRAAESGAARP